MPSFRFSLVVAALAAAYALSVYAYTSLPLDEWFPDDFTATLQTIGECTKEENGTMCARPAVIALLDVHSGEEITRAIDERFTPQQ